MGVVVQWMCVCRAGCVRLSFVLLNVRIVVVVGGEEIICPCHVHPWPAASRRAAARSVWTRAGSGAPAQTSPVARPLRHGRRRSAMSTLSGQKQWPARAARWFGRGRRLPRPIDTSCRRRRIAHAGRRRGKRVTRRRDRNGGGRVSYAVAVRSVPRDVLDARVCVPWRSFVLPPSRPVRVFRE